MNKKERKPFVMKSVTDSEYLFVEDRPKQEIMITLDEPLRRRIGSGIGRD